ncbi:MAG: hypothetical protein JW976_12205 [Syntrophaceae bacterium]|nr:hypothetical protein [Syntrophaceae bacterium]
MTTSNEAFPELRADQLKRYAKRWVKKFSNVPILEITLYRYSSQYPQLQKHEPIPTKYVVVIEVLDKWPDKCETYPDLVVATEYFQTVRGEHPYSALIDDGFRTAVYKNQPSDQFRQDWCFLSIIQGETPPNYVMLAEPYLVLFEQEEVLEFSEAFDAGCRKIETKRKIDELKQAQQSVPTSNIDGHKQMNKRLQELENEKEHLGQFLSGFIKLQGFHRDFFSDRDKVQQVCARSIRTGFISIRNLMTVLALDKNYSIKTLEKLWNDYDCSVLARKEFEDIVEELKNANKDHRGNKMNLTASEFQTAAYVGIWFYILMRWTSIPYSPFQKDSDYADYNCLKAYSYDRHRCTYKVVANEWERKESCCVSLKEVKALFKGELKLPPPGLLFPDERQKREIPSRVREVVKAAGMELQTVYASIKKNVGFSGAVADEKWRTCALHTLDANPLTFKYLTREILESNDVYVMAPGKERRDFLGKCLREIIKGQKLGTYSYQKLFEIYQV